MHFLNTLCRCLLTGSDYEGNGGPYSLIELKVIQEVISIMVFTGFTLLVFKNEQFRLNHLIAFVFLVLAVYFAFKK